MQHGLAQKIIGAYQAHQTFPYAADIDPGAPEHAYAMQAEVAKSLGASVAGWKCGLQDGGATAFAAPIFAENVRQTGGTWRLSPGQLLRIEVEIAIRLGKDLPPRGKPYGREDIVAAIDEVFAGIELVASRFSNVEEASFAAKLADNFNQAGYVIGGGAKDFARIDLSGLRARLWIDGALQHDAIGGHGHIDPLIPVVAWAARQCDALGGLRAGQFITTGTLNMPPVLDHAARIEIEIESLGRASLAIEQ